jgi:hypothetical protein
LDVGSGSKQQERAKFKKKMTRRDIYQRKAYAVRRMSLAAFRLNQATSEAEREQAKCWIKIWGVISRIRQFKLGNGGGSNGDNRR